MAQLNDLLVAGASRLLNGLGVLGNANMDSIFPNITDTYSLGSSDKRWNLLYAKTLNTYQETTDILTVNTKATIGNGAGSTSATTGSLIVKGGIGVSANSYFGGTITSSKFIGPLQGNADSATKWKTTRTLKIGDTGKSVDGTANVTWTSSDVGYRHEWSAVVTCATWSRLCYVAYGGNVLGSSFFLNIAATRNSVVYNDTFIIKSHHSSNGKIVKISGHNYSSGYQVRLLVDSGGNCYVELYDNINGATSSITQTVYCNLIPIYCGAITKYTSFASGATLPSGFSVKQTMTLDNNDIQANIKGNVTGNVVGNVAGNVSGSSGSCTGNSATATALTSNAGSTGQPVYFTGGKPATIDWHIGNSGVGEHNANNVTYNFCGYYTSNGPATSLGASTSDGALYAQAYSSTWVAQIAQDYRNGNLFVRGKNNGTWQSWKAILTSDYRPMVFHWSGQSGQPTWLWGGENGVDMYVYNPSNFVVAGASYLKDKTNGTATYLNYGASGMSSASWYGAWDGYTLRAISPANLANHLASTALNSIYLKYNGWWDGGNNSLNVNNASGMIFAYSNHGLPGSWGVVTTLEYQYNAAYKHQIYGDGWNNIMYFRTASSDRGGFNAWKRLWAQGDAVTGAVWNDYAEHREADTIESGYVLAETGQDSLIKTTERLQHFAGVSSDTWGFSQGETEKAKTPIAVAGRVLVYTYQNRNNYKPGDCVCAAPGGTVDIMTREEVILWPDRVVGTVSQVPDYDEWGGGDMADRSPVKINGRIWIKVK